MRGEWVRDAVAPHTRPAAACSRRNYLEEVLGRFLHIGIAALQAPLRQPPDQRLGGKLGRRSLAVCRGAIGTVAVP